VTRVLVEMFSVNQHVSGSSAKRSVSSRHKPTEKKKLKGALVSVASKNWFTVLAAVPVLSVFIFCCVIVRRFVCLRHWRMSAKAL